jgi:signal transduction histidine kinase
MEGVAQRLAGRWQRLDLTGRFMAASSITLILGMLLVGQWVASRISDGVIHTHATAAALYAQSFIEPRVQELANHPSLSADARRDLDALLLPEAMGGPVVGFRIWKGQRIVYSDKPNLVGSAHPTSRMRERAWAGKVVATYEQKETGDEPQIENDMPLLEIYAPVRRTGTTEIIALAETYQLAPDLPSELFKAQVGSWIVVGVFTAGLLMIQFLIVNWGNHTIKQQRAALDQRIAELSRILEENDSLRKKSVEANARVADTNERLLRRIGADLHDGPVQLLGMAMLRLGSLKEVVGSADESIVREAEDDLEVLRDGLQECLAEIRNLSAGLAPPAIEDLSLSDVVISVVRRHERRTGTSVRLELVGLPGSARLPVKSCLYRCVQEGLNNAFRHAEGKGQAVVAEVQDGFIRVSVLDAGPGLSSESRPEWHSGQGLLGLRDRIEALGGDLKIEQRPSGGVRLNASIPLLQAAEVPEAYHG